jgi:DNA-binding Lrp family transcriptional regulator
MWVNDEAKIQELVGALSDEYSRKILGATLMESKSSEEISREQNIPTSTCYRRIRDLVSQRILTISRIELRNGKKQIFYRSAYKNVTIVLDFDQLAVDATPNAFSLEKPTKISEQSGQVPLLNA